MSYPNVNTLSMMQPQPSFQGPKYPSYPGRQPLHAHQRDRSVVYIIESDSCSSVSTCSSRGCYTPPRYRSCSYPRRQQQQQPIVIWPVQYQAPQLALPSTSAPQQFIAGPIQYVQASAAP